MESVFGHLAIKKIWDWLCPRFCLRCGREGNLWCSSCEECFVLSMVRPSCPFCGQGDLPRVCPDCRGQVYLDGVVALASYADPTVRAAITTWKYHGDEQAGELLARFVAKAGSQLAFLGEGWMVCAVPLHISRERARGFNQADKIAAAAAGVGGWRHEKLLRRCRRTAAQATQASGGRAVGSLDGIFKCIGHVPEKVLLCDDVFTSGATMDAAARELKEHGAKEVWGLVMAKG